MGASGEPAIGGIRLHRSRDDDVRPRDAPSQRSLPVVVVIAARSAITPSRLLLPLAFGAHSGALLTLTGSPVSVLASEFAAEAGGGPFGFFSFAVMGWRARTALGILVAMMIAPATGIVPPAVAGLVAAAAMILSRVVPVERAHRSISWTTLLLVAGMIPLSTAITQTGTAELIAQGLVDLVGGLGPVAILAALCVVALVFGQLISNTATALILLPIAVSVAGELALSPLPFIMAVAVVSAAALLTPVATPANLMVQAPAGLRFGDYWKLGLPLMVLYLAVALAIVPLVWPF